MNAPSIVRLDQKLARAAELGKGIRLESADLDLLGSLGLFDMTHRAKSEYLKERTQCRDARRRSINGANTGSLMTNGQTELVEAPISMSGGTIPPRDASAARRRVR